MTSSYVSALTDGRWAEAAKVIDSAIQSAEVPTRLQLLINRGYCHQRLQLYRKALKAGHAQELLKAFWNKILPADL